MDTALFSPSVLFQDEDNEERDIEEREMQQHEQFVQRTHIFPGMVLTIREFSFHRFNANLLWPGTFTFCDWLSQNKSLVEGQRILELGSGTGALAIFIHKSFGVDITTSDVDDKEVEENIAYNCKANEVNVLPHMRHVKQYPNLIKTLSFLLKSYKPNSAADGTSKYKKIAIASEEELQLQKPLF
ncbi:hypothetical protein HPP92_003771 [Vanilla planifolia]|uniref:Uncharacterized protein n=1 Tax=Vanilla planifolia TaxID=51239 RepID=A0A835S2E3_VANPL|nr:hypothetical protein HPP92_003771 [Vanilla planifolia]